MNRTEDILVGLIGVVLLPLIATRIVRGLRERRLPVYRTYLTREENAAKFNALLVFHSLTFFAVAAMSADLLFDLGLRDLL